MKVITLARKPFDGTVAHNMLTHGCSGLNIDASRIGTTTRTNSSKAGQGNRDVLGPSSGGGGFTHGTETVVHDHGRWPSNVIVQHLDGCRREGVKKVGGGEGSFVGADGEVSEAHEGYTRPNSSAYTHKKPGHRKTFGEETVANWICEDGCPVAALDERSGDRPSTGNHPSSATKESIFRPNQGAYQKQGPLYSDNGGASRFFKQVKP